MLINEKCFQPFELIERIEPLELLHFSLRLKFLVDTGLETGANGKQTRSFYIKQKC